MWGSTGTHQPGARTNGEGKKLESFSIKLRNNVLRPHHHAARGVSAEAKRKQAPCEDGQKAWLRLMPARERVIWVDTDSVLQETSLGRFTLW